MTSTQPQTTTSTVFVAFLDILGFSDLVKNNSMQFVLDLYNEAIIKVNHHLQEFWQTEEWRDHVKRPKISSLCVSDSIIIYSDGNGLDSFLKIIVYIHSLIGMLIKHGLPVRGALTLGELGIYNDENNKILLGKAIVEAYELEKIQEWCGCIIDDKCYERFGYDYRIKTPLHALLGGFIHMIRYKAPIISKQSKEKSWYVVNWPVTYHEDEHNGANLYHFSRDILINSFSMHGKNISNPRVKSKISNTINFYEYAINARKIISEIPQELTNELMERFKHK